MQRGDRNPTFCEQVSVISDGAIGKALHCDDVQRLAWKAPHNIYAERGTLSFFWRSRYPAGPTEFPIFRVGYADHSSWDACWLRIDYNGHGFDAMITDINLSRARVSVTVDPFPEPEEWIHLALAWDEQYGIRFYINGALAAEEYRPAVYFAGLDQFGPHSRIISHWNVISDYNFIRGGDIDEIVIYDRMLDAHQIQKLSGGELIRDLPPMMPDMQDEAVRRGWALRNGFAPVQPPEIPDHASVRKAEIHDAYDLKRWWWKGCDGIRETTWPGVYNRSSLKGRNDYFQLPDWDCYSLSGRSITFHAPDEPYNRIEISGSAYGTLTDGRESLVYQRPSGAERTAAQIPTRIGGQLCFTNEEAEQPIGDFSLFYVIPGDKPRAGTRYRLSPGYRENVPEEADLADFIKGRYLPYEWDIATAYPEGGCPLPAGESGAEGFPFIHIIVPYEADSTRGLDGIVLRIPVPETTGDTGLIHFAVQIKDPLWYYRNLAHFTFSAEPGSLKQIWFDLRDRILPENRCLYLTIASDSPAFSASKKDVVIELIWKPAEEAKAEHILDRFTQVRDVYGHLVEEQPSSPKYNLYNRFYADIMDLLRVDPKHIPGQYYYYDKMVLRNKGDTSGYLPDYSIKKAPEDVPEWAFQQIEFLRHYQYLINWWIDNRQIENGEMGGGLSDDGDYTAMWVGLAEMGCDPDKIIASLEACNRAFYDQGMFTNGLPSIQSDELHSAEEGLISLGQCLTANFSNPQHLEHAMETARSLWWLTGINQAGHRHIRSSYYNGSKMAEEDPWGCQQSLSALAISPAWYVIRFNGNPKLMGLLKELADGLAAHYHPETGEVHSYIRFQDDAEIPYHNGRQGGNKCLFYPAYQLTGDRRYWDCIWEKGDERNFWKDVFQENQDENPVDKQAVAEKYEKLNFTAGVREYYNTLGHPWIDRVYFSSDEIQKDRLAGVAHVRNTCVYPMNRIRWRFEHPGDEQRIAILSPLAKEDRIKLIVCNISESPVTAQIIGSEVLPGVWRVTTGYDLNGDDLPDTDVLTFESGFERSFGVSLTFAPHMVAIVMMELVKPGDSYWRRCDLGISKEDVKLWPHGLNVRVHSLGSADSPEAGIALRGPDGSILKTAVLPPLEAPRDLWPRWREVSFQLHGIPSLEGCRVEIDPEHQLHEITRENNIIYL